MGQRVRRGGDNDSGSGEEATTTAGQARRRGAGTGLPFTSAYMHVHVPNPPGPHLCFAHSQVGVAGAGVALGACTHVEARGRRLTLHRLVGAHGAVGAQHFEV
jgi:hypothetical protein